MGQFAKNTQKSVSSKTWKQAQRILEILSSLSYRSGELHSYLKDIAIEMSSLLELDWSVVTFCWEDKERVMASSIEMGDGEHIYSLHGLLTETVVKTGKTLCVEDAIAYPEYGQAPEGYSSYLGVPLRISTGEVIGTICSFCIQPRQFILEEVHTVEIFAERAATAIDNYTLYQQQLRFNEILEEEVAKRTAELKAAQEQLIEQERLAAIGEFASMIVHEVRNPLTTITMGLNYFQRTYTSEGDRIRVSLALDEAYRLQNLLQEILLFAKPHHLQLEELDFNQLIVEILENLREMPEACQREIIFVPVSALFKIQGDKDKIKQILINLVRNAYEAISEGEKVTCKISPSDEPEYICLSVHNGGTPIPIEILPKLTQPFCSTKPEGTGLGLAIVKRIVEAHNGQLSIQSDSENGTIVKILLPLISPQTLSSI